MVRKPKISRRRKTRVRNQELIEQTTVKIKIALESDAPTMDRCLAVLDYHFACLDEEDETPLELAGLDRDICSYLYGSGITSVEQLCRMTESEVRNVEFMGAFRTQRVVESLARHGLTLKLT